MGASLLGIKLCESISIYAVVQKIYLLPPPLNHVAPCAFSMSCLHSVLHYPDYKSGAPQRLEVPGVHCM